MDRNTEPSDYFYFDLYPQSLIKDIIKVDYNDVYEEQQDNSIEAPSNHAMVKAIDKKSFGNIFDVIFKEAEKNHPLGFNELGEILDVISTCFEFDPIKRPSIQALFHSKLFE